MSVIGDNTPVLQGGTDGTEIGNVGDRLKVNSDGTASPVSSELVTVSAPVYTVAIANNKSMWSLVNGSTKKIKLVDLRIVNGQTTAVTGIIASFQLRRITSHSAGTVITKQLHDTTDTSEASVVARTGATVVGESADILRAVKYSSDEWGVGALDVESQMYPFQVFLNLLPEHPLVKPITLNQNEGIHIKQVTNSAVGTFNIIATFIEV